jgi:hypothetical protein
LSSFIPDSFITDSTPGPDELTPAPSAPSKQEAPGSGFGCVQRRSPCVSRTRKMPPSAGGLSQWSRNTVSGTGKMEEKGGVLRRCRFGSWPDHRCSEILRSGEGGVYFRTTFPDKLYNVECITASHQNDVALRQRLQGQIQGMDFLTDHRAHRTRRSDESWPKSRPQATEHPQPIFAPGYVYGVERYEKYCYLRPRRARLHLHSRSTSMAIHVERAFFVRCAPQ